MKMRAYPAVDDHGAAAPDADTLYTIVWLDVSSAPPKPATGWKFRVQKPEQDLILKPESGVAGIVQDELGNTYDLTGP